MAKHKKARVGAKSKGTAKRPNQRRAQATSYLIDSDENGMRKSYSKVSTPMYTD